MECVGGVVYLPVARANRDAVRWNAARKSTWAAPESRDPQDSRHTEICRLAGPAGWRTELRRVGESPCLLHTRASLSVRGVQSRVETKRDGVSIPAVLQIKSTGAHYELLRHVGPSMWGPGGTDLRLSRPSTIPYQFYTCTEGWQSRPRPCRVPS